LAGARVAGFHPLQTFADPELGLANLPGSTIGIEADDEIWPWLSSLAGQLHAKPLRLTADQRALYHVGSVLVSNCTVGLMAVSTALWSGLGIERTEALNALLPLLEGTVRNLKGLGLPRALTGPVARGNTGTVAAHLLALSEAPRALDVYRALSDWLIDLAEEGGTISPEQTAELRTLLLSDPPPKTERNPPS
jgi:predicted short-subunit dehydrogenase-like oxidoreductase (DUF2520 family)